MGMRFAVLGSLDAREHDGHVVDLSSRRQRQLLAALIVNAGSVVSDDRLTEMVWGDVPEGGVKALRTVVSRLRASLGDRDGNGYIVTRPPGYAFELNGSSLDADEFQRVATAGANHVRSGEWDQAIQSFEMALALWRGPALAEFADLEWARADAVRLEELRTVVVEALIDARLQRGEHAEVIGPLELLVAEHPFRERPRILMVTALYRAGRQTEALRAYTEYRETLAEELGLEPSIAMQELELQILRHDPALAPAAGAGPMVKSYQLIERLGAGTTGQVWRATHTALRREVAVKVMKRAVVDDDGFIRSFEADVRAIANLDHPHIAPVYDYWRDPTGAYVVMPLLSGGSIDDLVARDGVMPLEAVARLVEQIGGALEAAHHARSIHGAVHTGNVLLDSGGRLNLTDFGTVGVTAEARADLVDDLRRVRDVAPELLDAQATATPATDVYGLGRLVEAVLAPVDRRANRLQEVVRRSTHVDPGRRYPTVRDFVDDFALAIRDDAAAAAPTLTHLPNPYKGLRPFGSGDAADFFGRSALIDQLLEAVAGQRFTAVVGPSGAGKSSLVKAGLLPALRSGRIDGSQDWFVVTMVPGANPYEELEAALLHVAVNPPASLMEQLDSGPSGIARAVRRTLPGRDGRLLLVIDQFEELYTQSDPAVADRFISGMTKALEDRAAVVRAVITIRADFFDRPLGDHRLANLISAATVLVGAMSPEDLAAVIISPAERVGLHIEPALVAELVADAASQPAALPLLQFMLTELFEQRDSDTLTHDDYGQLGGLAGVVAGRAEQVYADLGPAARDAARLVFGRLVSIGDGTVDTRRRVRRTQLETGIDTAPTTEAIDSFGDARLVVFDRDPATREPTVEIAHEALLAAWPRLHAWLEQDRDLLRSLQQIGTACAAWESGGADESDLLRGARLAAAVGVEEIASDRLTDGERRFVTASRATFERDQHRQRRQNRRLRSSLIGVGVLLVAALIAGVVALQQRDRADEKANAAVDAAFVAETERLNSLPSHLVKSNRRAALLLAVEAYRRGANPQSLGALQRALVGSAGLVAYIAGTTRYESVMWLDNTRFVAARQNALDEYDHHGALLRTVEISGAERIAVAADTTIGVSTHEGVVSLVAPHATTGTTIGRYPDVQTMAFSPDGSQLAIGTKSGHVSLVDRVGHETGDVIDAHLERTVDDLPVTGAIDETTPHVFSSGIRGVTAMAFSDDGTKLGTVGFGMFRLWDLADGARALIAEHPLIRTVGATRIAAIPADVEMSVGGEIIVADRSHVWRFDPLSGQSTSDQSITARESSTSAGSPDSPVDVESGLVAVDLGVGTTLIADVGDTSSATSISSELVATTDIAIATGGRELVASGSDGLVVLSLSGDGPLDVSFEVPHRGDVYVAAAGSVVGVQTFVAGESGLWRIEDDRLVPVFPELANPVFITPANSGNFGVVVGERDVAVFDLLTGATVTPLPGWDTSHGTYGDVVSPDGRWVSITDDTGHTEIRSTTDGSIVYILDDFEFNFGVSFDPRSPRIAVWTETGRAGLFDLETSHFEEIVPDNSDVTRLAFTPDGSQLVNFRRDGTIIVRDSVTLQPTGTVFTGNTNAGGGDLGPWFTPDGSLMVTSSDGLGRLWDFATATQIGDAFPSDAGWVSNGSVDGRWLATGRGDRAVRWNLDTSSWAAIACAVVGRNLTADEWVEFGPRDVEYRPTCDNQPMPSARTEQKVTR
jgi:DNA-binding SARP family transcriptional activator/WD40 repeat protein